MKVIKLYEITPQEEIFCQNYVLSVDASLSAYHAGMFNNIKLEKEFDNLDLKELKGLSRAGNAALKKDKVKDRISELAAIEAEKNSIASLQEILEYLTLVLRKSKQNFKNVMLVNAAIKSCESLIKRYPEFAENKKDDKYIFKR